MILEAALQSNGARLFCVRTLAFPGGEEYTLPFARPVNTHRTCQNFPGRVSGDVFRWGITIEEFLGVLGALGVALIRDSA